MEGERNTMYLTCITLKLATTLLAEGRPLVSLLFDYSQAAVVINTRRLPYSTCTCQGRVQPANSKVHRASLSEKDSLRGECPHLGAMPQVKGGEFHICFYGNEMEIMWQNLGCCLWKQFHTVP